MTVTLQTQRVQNLEQVRCVAEGNEAVDFTLADRASAYEFMERTLVQFDYAALGKADKGAVKAYLGKMTGLSRAQLTWLMAQDLLRHPHATLGLSDAGAHLSFLCDAGFGLHLLGHWSRERGDIALPKAAQSVTSRVADAYRIRDRGRLVPGACAYLLLFDPDTVGRGEKVRVQDLPAGATRVHTPARGVHGVWVNEKWVVDASGRIEGAGTPGSLLRDFAD